MISVKFTYWISIFFFFFTTNLFSQNEYNWKQFWNETGDYYTAPLNWDKNDLMTFGLIAVSTFGIMQFDESIKSEVEKINSNKKHWLMEAGRYWGEPIPSLALSGILLIHGYAASNETTKKIGFEISQSFFYAVTVSSTLKIIIGRARPYTGSTANTFAPFSFNNSNWSHPSGHTTVAFSLSSVLAGNTNNDALKVLAFVPAILTATSRVYQNYHWASDVFLGAMVGYFTGKFVTDLHKQKEVSPIIYNTPIISLSFSF